MISLLAIAVLSAALTGQWLHYRPDARVRLHAALVEPLKRRGRNAHRSLTALARAARLKPYRPIHAPARHHYEETTR